MNQTTVIPLSLSKLETTFSRMKNEAGWDTNKPLLWGYFFYDHDKGKLEALGEKLDGFDIYPPEKKDNTYILHIAEKTIHSPQTLLDQCNKLGELAVKNNIEVFDGWDVGKTL